jgi:hypothetical protein
LRYSNGLSKNKSFREWLDDPASLINEFRTVEIQEIDKGAELLSRGPSYTSHAAPRWRPVRWPIPMSASTPGLPNCCSGQGPIPSGGRVHGGVAGFGGFA